MNITNHKGKLCTAVFLLLELILYAFILTAGGKKLVDSSFMSIVICFVYALLNVRHGSRLLVGALACTVAADFFLVICSPIRQLPGMICFLMAQTLYAIKLQRTVGNRKFLLARALMIVLAEVVTWIVLKEKTDALAMVSICYYSNLIVSIVEAFTQFGRNKLFPIGLVLFLLCDTIIGLQMAAGVYLPITEGTVLYNIIFVNFNLAWFFYLPSQVCIALSGVAPFNQPPGQKIV